MKFFSLTRKFFAWLKDQSLKDLNKHKEYHPIFHIIAACLSVWIPTFWFLPVGGILGCLVLAVLIGIILLVVSEGARRNFTAWFWSPLSVLPVIADIFCMPGILLHRGWQKLSRTIEAWELLEASKTFIHKGVARERVEPHIISISRGITFNEWLKQGHKTCALELFTEFVRDQLQRTVPLKTAGVTEGFEILRSEICGDVIRLIGAYRFITEKANSRGATQNKVECRIVALEYTQSEEHGALLVTDCASELVRSPDAYRVETMWANLKKDVGFDPYTFGKNRKSDGTGTVLTGDSSDSLGKTVSE